MSHRRWAYTLGGLPLEEPVEVATDYQAFAERQPLFTDRYYEGARSPIDGSDIGSRTKRREHMRVHGLVDADDYRETWAKQRAARETFRRTGEDGKDWAARFQETAERLGRDRRR